MYLQLQKGGDRLLLRPLDFGRYGRDRPVDGWKWGVGNS